ncbi:MAG: alkaline phosphatase family protein [Pseudomonadota bacterium]
MNGKVILVIMDGVGHDAAVTQCGFLEGCVELGRARRWKMRAALPTVSAAIYETLHTGLSPIDHGVTGNEALRRSTRPNTFSTCRQHGLRTAAVAQSFFFTLYQSRPYDPLLDVECDEPGEAIQYGRFYSMEGYGAANAVAPAEIDLCAQANLLIRRTDPSYLLLHTCSADTLGHTFGGDSAEYLKQAWRIDNALARVIPSWVEAGYDVFVTADHGMSSKGSHGGAEAGMRDVAFYAFSDAAGPREDQVLEQLAVAPTILSRIGAPIPGTMREPPFLTGRVAGFIESPAVVSAGRAPRKPARW